MRTRAKHPRQFNQRGNATCIVVGAGSGRVPVALVDAGAVIVCADEQGAGRRFAAAEEGDDVARLTSDVGPFQFEGLRKDDEASLRVRADTFELTQKPVCRRADATTAAVVAGVYVPGRETLQGRDVRQQPVRFNLVAVVEQQRGCVGGAGGGGLGQLLRAECGVADSGWWSDSRPRRQGRRAAAGTQVAGERRQRQRRDEKSAPGDRFHGRNTTTGGCGQAQFLRTISQARWLSSGKRSFSQARRTAPLLPGSETTSVLR